MRFLLRVCLPGAKIKIEKKEQMIAEVKAETKAGVEIEVEI